jgi:hypothetical protein
MVSVRIAGPETSSCWPPARPKSPLSCCGSYSERLTWTCLRVSKKPPCFSVNIGSPGASRNCQGGSDGHASATQLGDADRVQGSSACLSW